jgi:glutaredoxin 3
MIADIVVFQGKGCSVCHEQMQFLTNHGISYKARDVVTDTEARNELLRLGSKTLSTTLIDGEVMVGFDKACLIEMLGIGGL